MKDVEELSDRLIVINKGEIVYEGSVEGAIERFSGKKLIKFSLKNEKDKDKLKNFLYKIYEDEEGEYKILIDKTIASETIKNLFQNFDIEDITVEEPELEEVMCEIFEKK